MALRDKLAKNAGPYLREGEVVQHSFIALATSPMWSLLSYWIILIKDSNRAVVATDQRILLLKATRMSGTKLTGVVAELPRTARFGEPSGLNWKTEVFGTPIWVHKRFHKDVRAVDGA